MRLLAVLLACLAGALVSPAESRRFLDVRYATTPGVEANLQSLDIYAPPDAKACPVVIYLHGGHWMAGDKRTVGRLSEFFCGASYLFVSVNYRLAPKATHPAHIQDVAAAVAWVHDHIAEYGGDPAQIFLTGHSAGAHLAALLGTDAKRLGDAGKPLSILRAVIPLDSGAMDLNAVAANDRRSESPYRSAFGNDPAAWADASPSAHVASSKGLRPFQIVIAYGPAIENKRRGMAGFAEALRQQGTRAEVVDASSFREHQSLMTEFGATDDPVSKAVLEFIESVRSGKTVASLGRERVLQAEGKSAAEAASTLEAYRTRILMKQFDKNGDGKIERGEMPEQSRPLFDRLDANQDGVVTAEELTAYYQRTQPIVALADSTTATPTSINNSLRNESVAMPLARLVFTQDYFPGTRDANGQFMGGTEAMWLAGHDGKLFAAIGYGQDRPGSDPKPGAQVLRKDAPDAPWQVDHGFEPNFMRVEGLISFAFTTDLHGKPLPKPARLLIASPSELTRAGGASAVFIRSDATGQWQRSEITGGNLGVRSFGSHVDKVTGVHHLFAGLNRGGIHRGSYDSTAPGGIRWEAQPERTAEALPGKGRRIYDYSRVLCFAECNGDLYMASRITTGEDGQPVDGGLYRRVDGLKPSWEMVHRWAIDKDVLQSRFLRGLTTVPDPQGGKHQVLIANFEYPGIIARFDPTKAVIAAEQELDIKEFFNQAWNTPSARRRGAIAAYNRFLPVTDPKSDKTVWLCGAWVERPDSPNPPDNGSCYLIRHRDGRYDWGYIYDAAHPVPAGAKLTGCRDIEPSPFPGEQGRVFYFCGYDGGAGPSHNTAWIYRAKIPENNLPRNKP